MEFTPVGFVGILEALERIRERLYPGFADQPIYTFEVRDGMRDPDIPPVAVVEDVAAHLEEGHRQREQAKETLRHALAGGDLEAIAVPLEGDRNGERLRVPVRIWTDEDDMTLSTGRLETPRERSFHRAPCFLNEDSFAAWLHSIDPVTLSYSGEARSNGQLPVRHTIAAETQCENWLVGLMQNGPQTSPRDTYKEKARDKFGISGRGFNRAWGGAKKTVGNKSWGRPGPKSKR
jgi:hypothetical protein